MVVAAALVLSTLVDSGPAWLISGGILFAVMVYVSALRPRAGIRGPDLVFRQMFSTQVIPLASVGTSHVSRMLEVTVGGKRYSSPAVGRSLRRVIRPHGERDPMKVPADFVEDRIRSRRADAIARNDEAGPVTRTWAWPEIAVAALAAIAFVVTLFL